MRIKILATADLHLGMRFPSFEDEIAERLAEARFETLQRLVEEANLRECDLFVVAGDLFERRSVPREVISRTVSLLSTFRGKVAIVLPGNHDYYAGKETSPWADLANGLGDSEAVFILAQSPTPIPLEDYGIDATIFPGPCTSRHSAENNVDWIPTEINRGSGQSISIGLAHGSIEGLSPDFNQRYFPMTREILDEKAIDLWIVGHTHVRYPSQDQNEGKLFIPGTPEPEGFGDLQTGGAWYIEVDDKSNIRSEAIHTGIYRFEVLSVVVRGREDLDSTVNSINEAKSVLLWLRLSGTLPLAEYEKLGDIIDRIKERVLYLREDSSALVEEITRERVLDEFTEGSFPSDLLLALLEYGDSEAAGLAFELVKQVRK